MHHDLDSLLAQIASGDEVGLPELEQAYTTGCAEVLELEAEAMRTRRQADEMREQLRHVRTAIEWLQEVRAGRSAAQ